MKRGIPREEICFAGDAQTDKARAEMFEQLRKGEKRFIIASTSKLGTGANIQDKICAIHHLDIPWKPADLTQQDGRGIRQGNNFDEVGIYHYLTEETFDAYMMGIIKRPCACFRGCGRNGAYIFTNAGNRFGKPYD